MKLKSWSNTFFRSATHMEIAINQHSAWIWCWTVIRTTKRESPSFLELFEVSVGNILFIFVKLTRIFADNNNSHPIRKLVDTFIGNANKSGISVGKWIIWDFQNVKLFVQLDGHEFLIKIGFFVWDENADLQTGRACSSKSRTAACKIRNASTALYSWSAWKEMLM